MEAQTLDTQLVKPIHLEYMLFLPGDHCHAPKESWPLILYLHGAQLREEPLTEIPNYGVPRRAINDPSFPFIVVAPRCPPGLNWTLLVDHLDVLLKEVQRRYRVNPAQVYLTGLSMGGWGAWHFAKLYPQRFAAVVSVCGFLPRVPGSNWASGVEVLKDASIWVFHGVEDDVVPVGESRRIVDELRVVGGNVQYSELPGRGHDIWNDVYDRADLYDWLLSQ